MADHAQIFVSLHLSGTDLSPDEVTTALGHAATNAKPARSYSATGVAQSLVSGGNWILFPEQDGSRDLDRHIGDLLALLTSDMSSWHKLEKYHPRLWVEVFMVDRHGLDENLELGVDTMRALAERGIYIEFNISPPRSRTEVGANE